MAKKTTGCFILLLILIPLGLIAAGGWYSMQKYKKLQHKISTEISEIKPFDQEASSREAAKELKLSLPVQKPEMTKDQVLEATKKELKEIARKNVLTSNLSLKTKAIIKKYQMAKEGDKISFLLNTTGKRVTGTYQGTFSDWKGKLIKVDQQKYRVYDIGMESHYYFDEVISKRRAAEEIAALKKEFDEQRKNVMLENKNKVLEKHYTSAGYRKQGNDWKPNNQVYSELIEQFEQKYKRDKEKTIKDIYENNKLFGLISVALNGETLEEEKDENEKKEKN